jgi:anti-sigma factor ChrR (cupin superfamily)
VTDSDQPDLADSVLAGPPADADPALCREADELVVALARAVAPVAPPKGVRDRLLAQIAHQAVTQLASDAVWEETGIRGLTRRVLFADRSNNRLTMLLRMTAGGRLPAHPHRGVEEVFILEGDLHAEGGSVLRAGDYQRNEAGSQHVEQWSVEGCTALLIIPLGRSAA